MRTFCSDLLGSKANENRQPKSITYVYVTFLPPIYGYTNLYTYNMYIHYIYITLNNNIYIYMSHTFLRLVS